MKRINLKKVTGSWEMILVTILILLNILLMILETDIFFKEGTVAFIIKSIMPLSFMVLGMIPVLLLGEIDVSIASTMIASLTAMGLLCDAGVPAFFAVLATLVVGGLLGAFNGVLIAKFKMPSVIVTIATSMLFRGVVEIILSGNTLSNFPSLFSVLAWQDIGGILPYSTILFIIFAVIFGVVLNKTKLGREIYVIGNAETTARYSAVNVDMVRIVVFTLMGVMAALSGMLFVGRLGGITSSMGKGYELQVIAIAVLGGVSSTGGKGNVFGPFVATFIMAYVSKTLDLIGVHANVQKIITGIILLVAVAVPLLQKAFKRISAKGVNKS